MKKIQDLDLDSLLVDLKELTETNAHGEALEKAASFFGDKQLAKAFEAINTLHITLGYLDSPIAELRVKFIRTLLERIKQNYGEETRQAIYKCI